MYRTRIKLKLPQQVGVFSCEFYVSYTIQANTERRIEKKENKPVD